MHQMTGDGARGEVWHSESWTAYEAPDAESHVRGYLLLACPASHVREQELRHRLH